MSQTYFAILTAVGEAKLANAAALGTKLQISKMAVGDGNGALPTPARTQTTLVNERYRASLNTLSVDPRNASQVMTEMVIPETEGGWWIREMGLYDAAGDLIAVSNCPPSYKPQMAEGSGRTQVLRMVLIVSSTTSVQLKIDPSVVLATREYVDVALADKLPADKVAGTYTQVSVSERGIVLAGANPTTLAGYGITDAYKRLDVEYLINQAVKDLAAKANTLAGYGITDAYKKLDVEYLISQSVTALLPKRSFAISDFIRIPDVPGGLILQMGTELVGSEASVDITLPLTFNTGRGAIAGIAANAATNQGNFSAYASLRSNSTIRVTQDVSTTSAGSNQYIHWFAWGN